MKLLPRLSVAAALIAASLFLAGCQSSEERAEGYFQSGMQLLVSGDEDRALVEFRNVFKYNGFHKEARKTYADILYKRGTIPEAYSQYLRLIEQYPDTPEVRQTLAEIAISRGDWDEAERHGRAAIALAPDRPGVPAIGLVLSYRKAVLDNDAGARAKIAAEAVELLKTEPDSLISRRIVIDSLMAGPDPQLALPMIDAAIEQSPETLEFQLLKFRLLALANDVPGTGAQLKRMYALFPENQDVQQALIGWYLIQKDLDGAETFLRELAGDVTANPQGHVAVVQFLQQARSPEAASAELDRLIAANTGDNAAVYVALRATMDFEAGRQDDAIVALQTTLKNTPDSDQVRRLKVILARMLDATGSRVGARALVEETLAADPTNTEALKLRATWLISEDKPGDAIIDLRAALNQNPRDSQILTLLASAHERDGSLDLAAERLAMAVEVSGSGPDEALRYARFLMGQNRNQVAETVLVDARRVSPTHVGVLASLADLYLRGRDWPRAQEVVTALRALPGDVARNAAQELQAALLLGQDRTADGLAFLESQVGQSGSGDTRAIALIVQTQIRNGKTAEARRYLDEQIAKDPGNPGLQMLNASLHALVGELPEAESAFREIIKQNPTAEGPVQMLYGLLRSAGRAEDAAAVLDAALVAQPKSNTLRLTKAVALEQMGDIDGAIAIYEALYAEDSGNVITANNLASLITTYRNDPESLTRAADIARRLRGSDVPAFQDTYGWIEYRRGNLEEALANLEPAAAGLPNDPMTQYHLGMAYVSLGRSEDARKVLTKALEIAGDSPLPQFEEARKTLAGLPPAPANP